MTQQDANDLLQPSISSAQQQWAMKILDLQSDGGLSNGSDNAKVAVAFFKNLERSDYSASSPSIQAADCLINDSPNICPAFADYEENKKLESIDAIITNLAILESDTIGSSVSLADRIKSQLVPYFSSAFDSVSQYAKRTHWVADSILISPRVNEPVVTDVVLTVFHFSAIRPSQRLGIQAAGIQRLRDVYDGEELISSIGDVKKSCSKLPTLEYMPFLQSLVRLDSDLATHALPNASRYALDWVSRQSLPERSLLSRVSPYWYIALAVAVGVLSGIMNANDQKGGARRHRTNFSSGVVNPIAKKDPLGLNTMTVQQAIQSKAVFKILMKEEKWKASGLEGTFDKMEASVAKYPELGDAMFMDFNKALKGLRRKEKQNEATK